MSRNKVSEEQKKKSAQRAVSKFHKEHMKVFTFRFHKENQCDIIEHLESQKNKAGYIAELIRQDLIAHGKQPFARQRVCDVVKDIEDRDVVVLIFKDGSRMLGSKDDFENDDRLVDNVIVEEQINHKTYVVEVRYS